MKPAMDALVKHLEARGWRDRVRVDAPMSEYTTFRIGGAADVLAEAKSTAELRELWQAACDFGVHCLVLGRCSNILVADRGVRGLVVLNHCQGYDLSETGRLTVASGTSLGDAARLSAAAGWAGLEWSVGIPGSVGGAVVGNAGAHGGYMGDALQSVTLLEHGRIVIRSVAEIGMGYRTTALKQAPACNGRPVILDATFALRPGDGVELARQMDEWLHWRRERQPQEPSAGSVFKRTAQYPAGFLIDQAGLKGRSRGGATISTQHANFIINQGGATAADVRGLAEEVQEIVEQNFGAHLEMEIELIGEW
jgi:UDP-N-acetylmuramate dehydrogenase